MTRSILKAGTTGQHQDQRQVESSFPFPPHNISHVFGELSKKPGKHNTHAHPGGRGNLSRDLSRRIAKCIDDSDYTYQCIEYCSLRGTFLSVAAVARCTTKRWLLAERVAVVHERAERVSDRSSAPRRLSHADVVPAGKFSLFLL